MKVTIEREPQVAPIRRVVVELTQMQAHDLHTIVSIPEDLLRDALRQANERRAPERINTNNVYGLQAKLAAELAPASGYGV